MKRCTCCFLLICLVFITGPDLVMSAEIISEHQSIQSWEGTPTCLQCHETEAQEVFDSVHYQWLGETPYMNDGPWFQGKLDVGVNSYCINITGNWEGCSSCHVGLGLRPELSETRAQLENIDCLICHQKEYKRKKIGGSFVADAEQMNISILEAARSVHKPTRATCLQCHAKGGGGDNYKRGDMALAHISTSDINFDVHMAVTGANLSCQSCHLTENHRMAGRGSDIRPTDLDLEMACASCHEGKDQLNGHGDQRIGRHVARVACQSCHIPTFARNAADTPASEHTEIHRDWRLPHTIASGAIHPTPTLAGDLLPHYRWWDGTSTSYLLYDEAHIDAETERIPTSRPLGSVNGAYTKLYPFKYKTATQPLATKRDELIALDTSIYFSTGNADSATRSGLVNMGYQQTELYSWVETDTFQLITHQVAQSTRALTCSDCHQQSVRMNLTGSLGYELKGLRETVCTQCHGTKDGEDEPEYLWIHAEHVKEENLDCSWCHNFSRPERNLELSPILVKLQNLITALKILIGIQVSPTLTLTDVDGDGRIGLGEAVDQLIKVSEE